MERTIRSIVNFAVRVAEPVEVILFGSMARGTNHVQSDFDLLVVTEDERHSEQIVVEIQEYARERALEADVLVVSTAGLQKALEKPHSFVASVYRHGKFFYRKNEILLA